MDKNGKLFGKINIIDFAAIIVIVLAVVGIAYRFISIAGENVMTKSNFTYTVEIDGVRIYTVNALEKKGTVTDKDGNILGEIVDVNYKDKEIQTILENGQSIMTKVPEQYVVEVTLEAEGKESELGYFVGENTELSVGGGIAMHTKYANSSGKITNIQKIENQGQ